MPCFSVCFFLLANVKLAHLMAILPRNCSESQIHQWILGECNSTSFSRWIYYETETSDLATIQLAVQAYCLL